MPTTRTANPDKKLIERCDPSVRNRRRVELAVVRRLCQTFLGKGYKITVDNERGYDENRLLASTDINKIIDEAFACDETHLFFHSPDSTQYIDPSDGAIDCNGWVYLVLGNDGYDVISDYTTNLESTVGPIVDWASDKFCK